MKKSLTILTIAVLAILTFTSSVFAATATVDPASTQKITAGQQVKVTVTADGRGADFKIAYDSSKFTLDEDASKAASPAITTINPNYKGTGKIMVVSTSNTNTIVFTAKEDMEVPAGEEAKAYSFTIEELHSVGADDVASTQATTTVTPSTTPSGSGSEGNVPGDGNGENGGSGVSKNETPVDKKGNPITEITNAGTPVFAGAIALIAISGAVLVIRNRK